MKTTTIGRETMKMDGEEDGIPSWVFRQGNQENWLLIHQTNLGSQPVKVQRGDVNTVQHDSTAQWLVESFNQCNNCRFTIALRTN